MKRAFPFKKRYEDDYITVAYVPCRCGEMCAIVIRDDFMTTAAECAYCGMPFTEQNIDGRIRVETYSISRWKEVFEDGKDKI